MGSGLQSTGEGNRSSRLRALHGTEIAGFNRFAYCR